MKLRTKSVGIALTVVLATALLGSAGAQDASPPAALAAQGGDLAESILAAKERGLGEPFEAKVRASLKSRMEALSMEQLAGLAQQGESANLPLALGSVTSDLVYTPVTPCRAFDSRASAGGPGPIAANSQRNVFVAGTAGFPAQGGLAGGCGVPVGATSAIINFVVVSPSGPGDIRAWAVALPQPVAPLAAIINYGAVAGLPAIANGIAVPLCNPAATSCTLGDLRLQADNAATDILGDVVGYFGPAVGGFVDLTTAQTVAGSKAFSSPIVGSVTGSAASVTGIVPIANGGTGSAAQNFVDLTTAQAVGGNKTFTGNLALGASTATSGNIMKGGNLFIHSFGLLSTFIGENAGNFSMTGTGSNTGVGTKALFSNTTGFNNTASGKNALQNNTTGMRNTASGADALAGNTTGQQNTASGSGALQGNTFGNSNTASGVTALQSNTIGTQNTASGVSALLFNASGSNNTASGVNALFSNASGTQNTASGESALQGNTTGNFNTASGVAALSSNTTGALNTAIGHQANVASGALTNATAIGAGAIVNASNKIRLGNASVTVIEGQVAYTFPSDRTKKENLRDVNAQEILEKLRRISVTSWNYIGHDPKEFRHYGPMAQDFFAAFGRDEVGAIGTDTTIISGDIAAVLMIGLKGLDAQVQKDQGTIAAQAAQIREQNAENREQAAEIASLKQETAELRLQAAEMASLKQQVSSMGELLKTLSQQTGITRASLVAGGQEQR